MMLFLSQSHGKNTFFHGHTYTGNQLVCSVALENINLFKKEASDWAHSKDVSNIKTTFRGTSTS